MNDSRSLRTLATILTALLAACSSFRAEGESSTDPFAEAPTLDLRKPSIIVKPRISLDDPVPAPSIDGLVAPTPTPASVVPAKSSYNSVDVAGPYIALTFDDGPHATLTPKLLDVLKARGARATFYVVGQNVKLYPDIIRRMVEEGHEVGNHTWNHASLTKLGPDGVKSQMDRTTAAIVEATGRRPATMRPPYGTMNARLAKRMDDEFGMKVIMWSVDPLDWRYRNAERVTREIVTKTQPGAIVLAHDIHASTVAAMPATIDGLKARGFQFVTVSELIGMEGRGAHVQASPTPAPAPATD
jgi:peptidoglycan/xylan/chitin deacetylase (PgdA/CDA1 family)